jgi:hypothetical protein
MQDTIKNRFSKFLQHLFYNISILSYLILFMRFLIIFRPLLTITVFLDSTLLYFFYFPELKKL